MKMSQGNPSACGCTVPSARVSAIRLNRVLAWLLVAMPWAHVAMGTPFWRGLGYDLVILAAHGLLSLALFGLPRAREERWLLWLGIAPRGMTPRNRFLFTGWSIAAACMSLGLAAGLWWGTNRSFFGALMLLLYVQVPLLWIPLPFRMIGHVYQAADYALARRRRSRQALRQNGAGLLAVVYLLGHAVNLVT